VYPGDNAPPAEAAQRQRSQETIQMATLYVQEQGTTVRKRAQQVLITKGDQTLQAVPLNKIDQVVLMGTGVQLSTALLVDLLGRGIPVTLTNQSGSRHYATLTAGPSRFAELRLRQMQRIVDPAWALDHARAIVGAKLRNQRAILAATGWPSAPAAEAQIASAAAGLASADNLDVVRGYEGAAAAAYFGAWRATLGSTWGFQGRAFHPPPDPLNALLSFGYTLLMRDVLAAAQLAGLDPYVGVLHTIEAGRPSLALDLMEEFRPLMVDRLVLDLLRNDQLRHEQFASSNRRQGAVAIDAAVRALLIGRYETAMGAPTPLVTGEQTAMRRILLLQAQSLSRVIRGEQAHYVNYRRG
jgi:CRISP-associated protein Cas1